MPPQLSQEDAAIFDLVERPRGHRELVLDGLQGTHRITTPEVTAFQVREDAAQDLTLRDRFQVRIRRNRITERGPNLGAQMMARHFLPAVEGVEIPVMDTIAELDEEVAGSAHPIDRKSGAAPHLHEHQGKQDGHPAFPLQDSGQT